MQLQVSTPRQEAAFAQTTGSKDARPRCFGVCQPWCCRYYSYYGSRLRPGGLRARSTTTSPSQHHRARTHHPLHGQQQRSGCLPAQASTLRRDQLLRAAQLEGLEGVPRHVGSGLLHCNPSLLDVSPNSLLYSTLRVYMAMLLTNATARSGIPTPSWMLTQACTTAPRLRLS